MADVRNFKPRLSSSRLFSKGSKDLDSGVVDDSVFNRMTSSFEEKKFLITGPSHGERDINSLISKNPNIIEFSEEEIELGNYNLAKMGINKNDEFVCITIRDNFYFKN